MKFSRHLTLDANLLRERFASLQTSRDVAALLEVPYSQLVYLTHRSPAGSRYRLFTLPKRSGGTRTIMAPNFSLKVLQVKLNTVLTAVYKPKPAAHGFVIGRSVVTNAAPHCGRRLVFNVDLENFFPTINFGRVRGMFMAKPYSLPVAVATTFAQICCFENQLPQGAPTSPMVSNMICSRLDTELERLAKKNTCSYTRYADDITFSTYRSKFAEGICSHVDGGVSPGLDLFNIILGNGFAINENKVHLQRWDSHQQVTGVTVNRKPNVRRSYIRQLRAMLYAWKKFGIGGAARAHFHRNTTDNPLMKYDAVAFENIVRGRIAYLGMVRNKDGLYQNYIKQLDRLTSSIDPVLKIGDVSVPTMTKVFVSHSAKDRDLARALVAYLEACLEIPDNSIRCTSVDGYKLDPGVNAHETLRDNLQHCHAVIGLLTEDSLKSGFVFMELGAAWVLKKITFPVLAPRIDFSRVPDPLRATHGIKVDDQAGLATLADVISREVGFPLRNSARRNAALQDFTSKVAALAAAAVPGTP